MYFSKENICGTISLLHSVLFPLVGPNQKYLEGLLIKFADDSELGEAANVEESGYRMILLFCELGQIMRRRAVRQ